MATVLSKLLSLLDPDTKLLAFDKLQHYALGGILATALFDIHFSNVEAFWLTVAAAVYWELAQTDVAYSIRDCGGARYAGRPGYGFGLLDIFVSILGSLTYLGAKAQLSLLV